MGAAIPIPTEAMRLWSRHVSMVGTAPKFEPKTVRLFQHPQGYVVEGVCTKKRRLIHVLLTSRKDFVG